MTTPTMTSPAAPLERKAWVEQVMGMPVSIHLRGHELSRPRAVEAVRAAYATLRRLDGIFSTYRPDSEVMRLQRGEVSIGQCCVEVREVLAIGEQAERRTGGAFTTLLPTGVGELAFDPTGLVKGWAVDVVARELAGLSDVSYCINAGGDLLIGAHPDVPLSGSLVDRRRHRAAQRLRLDQLAGGDRGPTRPVGDRSNGPHDARSRRDLWHGGPWRPPVRPGHRRVRRSVRLGHRHRPGARLGRHLGDRTVRRRRAGP